MSTDTAKTRLSTKPWRSVALVIGTVILLILIYLYILPNGFRSRNVDVSEAQVAGAKLYGYRLPGSYVSSAGWQQHIWILTLPLDCQNNHVFTRVRTFYVDGSGQFHFDIDVSPSHDTWNTDRPTRSVPVTLDWVKGSTVEAQSDETGSLIRIQDVRGMDILINSTARLTDTLALLAKFQPFGKFDSVNPNQWITACNAD